MASLSYGTRQSVLNKGMHKQALHAYECYTRFVPDIIYHYSVMTLIRVYR